VPQQCKRPTHSCHQVLEEPTSFQYACEAALWRLPYVCFKRSKQQHKSEQTYLKLLTLHLRFSSNHVQDNYHPRRFHGRISFSLPPRCALCCAHGPPTARPVLCAPQVLTAPRIVRLFMRAGICTPVRRSENMRNLSSEGHTNDVRRHFELHTSWSVPFPHIAFNRPFPTNHFPLFTHLRTTIPLHEALYGLMTPHSSNSLERALPSPHPPLTIKINLLSTHQHVLDTLLCVRTPIRILPCVIGHRAANSLEFRPCARRLL